MKKDQRDLLLEFNARNVSFLIIGGYAYSHYTEPRATKDLDVLIATTDENVQLVYEALVNFGAPLDGVTARDFQQPKSWFQIGVPPGRIDIVQSIDAIDFDSAWENSLEGIIDDDIPVRFISLEDLIRNKLAVGRLRDLADVEDLRAAVVANSKLTKPQGE
jgi:hypothetical protein